MYKKGESKLAPRTCRQCGVEFIGGPRAWYCPNCRLERQRESNRRMRQKLRAQGQADRPLGSIDKCVVCGTPYVVESSQQKYCKKCAPVAYKAVDKALSKHWFEEAYSKYGEAFYQKRLARNRRWAHEHVSKLNICPICGTEVRGRKYCCNACAAAGRRYKIATYNFKSGKVKTEPKFSDYQKGGRLYESSRKNQNGHQQPRHGARRH